ncbi:MAG: hypothetical protein WC254_01035 [Candidatus Woesearchaeota archaeon]
MVKKSVKKKIKKSNFSFKQLSKVQRNLIVGVVVVAVVIVLYYLLASEGGILVDEDETYLQGQDDLVENLPQITGESYFGYMKEGYVLNVMINGESRRVEVVALNEDYTVDIVMNRAYNLEIGETVLADYDYDGAADLAFTLDGVDYYNKRFSATITYFGELPDELLTE